MSSGKREAPEAEGTARSWDQVQVPTSCARGEPCSDRSRGKFFQMPIWRCCVDGSISRKNGELTAVPVAETGLRTAGEAGLCSDSAPLRHLNQSSALLSGRPRTCSPLSALLLSRNLLFFKAFLPRCDVLQAPKPISLLPCQTDETIHLAAPSSPPHPALAPQLTPGSGSDPGVPEAEDRPVCLNQSWRHGGAAVFSLPSKDNWALADSPKGHKYLQGSL